MSFLFTIPFNLYKVVIASLALAGLAPVTVASPIPTPSAPGSDKLSVVTERSPQATTTRLPAVHNPDSLEKRLWYEFGELKPPEFDKLKMKFFMDDWKDPDIDYGDSDSESDDDPEPSKPPSTPGSDKGSGGGEEEEEEEEEEWW